MTPWLHRGSGGRRRGGAFRPRLAVRAAAGLLWVTLGALCLGSSPALAAEEEHPYIASHSIIGLGKPFAGACGVATDSYGDVYVTNYFEQLIFVYSPAGKKLAEFKVNFANGSCSLAVDSAGAVYVEEYNGQVAKYKPSVFPPTPETKYALEESAGAKGVIVAKSGHAHAIAVDPLTQHLYVASAAHISSYEANGKLLSSTIGEGLVSEPDFYGVDVYGSNGDVYVTDIVHGRVYLLNPEGTEILKEISGAGSPAGIFENYKSSHFMENLAVDQSSGDVYVYYGHHTEGAVYEFNSSGGYLSKIGHKFNGSLGLEIFEGADVAVDNGPFSPNQKDVYVASEDQPHEADDVFAFGPSIEYPLEAKNVNTSAGTVTSVPAGIECGSTCSAEFAKGETVELKAEPKTGFVFAGWSGACSGEGPCKVTMGEAEDVTATWKAAGHPKLKVEKSGEGTVTSQPAGIECGGTCEASFEEDSVVTLKAEAASGFKFTGWTGCAPLANQAECTVTMSEAHTVKASFEIASGPQSLKVEKEGAGEGTVGSAPAGIECGSACEALFAEGEKVTLKAVQTLGSKFAGWTGCTPLPDPTECTVAMSEAHTVKAVFSLAAHYALQVKTAGTGAGTVVGPAGIGCPSVCEASFEEGTVVTLEAKPEPAAGFASTFAGWSGACAGAATTCKVSMSEARTVTATFERGTIEYPLRVLDAGAGEGTVSSAPLGVGCGLMCSGPIDCGSTCEASVEAGTIVELVAIPASDSTFAGWSGACTGVGVCEVTMNEAREVTATFEPIAASRYVLQVDKSGDGAGTVTGAPAGIDCGSTCTASFEAGATVELKAVADAGYTFAGWSGACTGSEAACEVTMSQAQTATATFTVAKIPLPPFQAPSGLATTTGLATSTGAGSTHVPLPAPAGKLTLASVGAVAGGETPLRLRCSASGPCNGTLSLTIAVKRGPRTKTLVIGHASYNISAGGSQTVKIALSSLARGILRHRNLRAVLITGPGVHSALTLESDAKRRHR